MGKNVYHEGKLIAHSSRFNFDPFITLNLSIILLDSSKEMHHGYSSLPKELPFDIFYSVYTCTYMMWLRKDKF